MSLVGRVFERLTRRVGRDRNAHVLPMCMRLCVNGTERKTHPSFHGMLGRVPNTTLDSLCVWKRGRGTNQFVSNKETNRKKKNRGTDTSIRIDWIDVVSEIFSLCPRCTQDGSRKYPWSQFPPSHGKLNSTNDSNTIDVHEWAVSSRRPSVQCVKEAIQHVSVDTTLVHMATKIPLPLVKEAERNNMDVLHRRNRDPNDPYFAVKAEVEWAIEQVMDKQPWMTDSKKRIMVEAADMELKELEEAVDVMCTNPARFELSDAEVDQRVEETKDLRRKIFSLQVQAKKKTDPPRDHAKSSDSNLSAYQIRTAKEIPDENVPLLCTSSSTMPPSSTRDAYEEAKCTWQIDPPREHVAPILSEDEQVDVFNNQVMDIRFFGREAEGGLDTQNSMLEDLDDEMETVQGHIAQARRIMKKLIGGTRHGWYTLICVLIALLIVLVTLFLQ